MAAEAAVSFAVETLGKMLIEKAQFLIGVEEDVKWLQKELKSIQCFMKDAAKKQSDDESIRNWISDIREVAHDAEDAIEIFVLKVQSKSLKKMYGCFPNHLYHLYKVGEQIKSIRKTLIDIQDRRVRYKFENDGSGDQKAEPSSRKRSQGEEIEARRRVAHWKPDQQVVGLEEDVKLLLGEAVLKESKGLSVAAIVGMGGLGKSTLANKIYKHPDVTGGFEFRAWVVVSSEFSKEDIMKRMLLNLGIPDPELNRLMSIANNLDREEELTKEVHKRLTGKRYFIVLDDVWEAADWQTLSTAFPHGGLLVFVCTNGYSRQFCSCSCARTDIHDIFVRVRVHDRVFTTVSLVFVSPSPIYCRGICYIYMELELTLSGGDNGGNGCYAMCVR